MLKKRLTHLLALATVGVFAFSSLHTNFVTAQDAAVAAEPTGPVLADELNTVQVVSDNGTSVAAVSVQYRGVVISPFDDFFRQFPGFQGLPGMPDLQSRTPSERVQRASGSAFVIGDNEIVTNFHVVENALASGSTDLLDGARITLTFPTSEDEYEAHVVGVNPDYDLALLALDQAELPDGVQPLVIADSSTAQVGQKVIAIGNPFGLQSSVSQGIVSAIGRELPSIGQVRIPMIQTDAAINPGNSGGPLLDSSGRLVGINTMIVPGMTANGSAGNVGVGFAVPSELLLEALPDLRTGGVTGAYAVLSGDVANRPRLGVRVLEVDGLPSSVRQALGLPDHGLLVIEAEAGGPAQEAGLRGSTFDATIEGQTIPAGGDVILTANGREIQQVADIYAVIAGAEEGDEVQITYLRDRQEHETTLRLKVVPTTEEE